MAISTALIATITLSILCYFIYSRLHNAGNRKTEPKVKSYKPKAPPEPEESQLQEQTQ
jgi:hypothetical protein